MWIPTEHEKYGVGKFVFNSSRDSERLLLLLNQCNVTTYTVCLFLFLMRDLRAFVYTCLVKKQVFRYFL